MYDNNADAEQEYESWSEDENPKNGAVKRVFKIVTAITLLCVMLFMGNELRILYEIRSDNQHIKDTVDWETVFDMCEDKFEVLRNGEFIKWRYTTWRDVDSENIGTFTFADYEPYNSLPSEEIEALDYIHTSKELPYVIGSAWAFGNAIMFETPISNSCVISIWAGEPQLYYSQPDIVDSIGYGYYLVIRSKCPRNTKLGSVSLWTIEVVSTFLLLLLYKSPKIKWKKNKLVKAISYEVDTSTLIERSCRYATITNKQMIKIAGRTSHRYECNVEFTYDDGNKIVLDTSMEFYYEARIGERKLLTVRNGYLDDFSDDDGEFTEEIDEFALDDYDEAIDIPLVDTYEPDELFAPDERKESTEEEKVLEQNLKKGELLPPCVFHSDSGSYSLPAYPPLLLIQLSGMYPFLRRTRGIQELFEEAFVKASQALLGDKSLPRTGENTSSVTLRNNVFQVYVTITETMKQEDYEIKSDFSINDDLH